MEFKTFITRAQFLALQVLINSGINNAVVRYRARGEYNVCRDVVVGGGRNIYSADITWKMFCQVSLGYMQVFFLGMKWILWTERIDMNLGNRPSCTYAEGHLVSSVKSCAHILKVIGSRSISKSP